MVGIFPREEPHQLPNEQFSEPGNAGTLHLNSLSKEASVTKNVSHYMTGGPLTMMRMMVVRRRTDPKTETHALCEPAQSKCTWIFTKATMCENLQVK